ncbi:cation-translocating P-type ATPase [Methanococcoides alaskense]|uniref:Ca2+-transporting ATPase n=1 Tax=Methanococcoides alaskense TaxID=325778 RepID=A0AA90TZW2_9EURY|nr:cation-transporting P-type ATPase [Methanococcoides alaskense]MDA0524772.1 cation-transporting P-type ATPase [Methanococcoides alaskense]MDR6223107.1 Ca2+-transporting ATPase [Methanococcoides alaskense]
MVYENTDIESVFAEVDSSRSGLSETDVKKRLEVSGFNELQEKAKITPAKVLLRQFTNFIVWVLLAAAVISLMIDEVVNFGVIIFLVAFVIVLGFVQEYKAEKAMEALKRMVQSITHVVRDGTVAEIPTRDIVVGDVLVLETGDKVAADAFVFEIMRLKVDESAITGESFSIEKGIGDPIFSGTQIVHGKCKAVVTATGMQTQLGGIASMIQEDEVMTPLQQKINELSKHLAIIALVASGLTFVLGYATGAPLEGMLIIALALAVAAVPEGLPLTMTITLAYGMNRMAKHNAIIRRMLGVETLGSTTVICTDKTGTLTKNEMTVEKLFVNGQFFDVTGIGYEPEGVLLKDDLEADVNENKALGTLLTGISLCNNASLVQRHGVWEVSGDPTEVSLIVAAAKAGLWKDDLEVEYEKVHEIMFTSERKLMTTIHESPEGRLVFCKGAPEFVLDRCVSIERDDGVHDLSAADVKGILDENNGFASSAYRVLGVSYRKLPEGTAVEDSEKDLIFVGLVAMIDPVREEAKESIALCRRAGIRVVMITGDNEETAKAIGKKIGLMADYHGSLDGMDERLHGIIKDGSITGSELLSLDDGEFDKLVEGISVYARVMPEQKLRIVKALQNRGHVVAMTGDGVNDAPALKRADIGISMGIKGTDVAKESSLMVLQDDNFGTIVEAVKRGRAIYENIEKFTTYLVSRNFTEIILIMLGIILLGFDLIPLLALQILFINMFDEVMPAIALGLDPVRDEVMYESPRRPGEKILNRRNLMLVVSIAALMGVVCFLVFVLSDPAGDLEKARTLTFATIVSMILFIPFVFRSLTSSFLSVGVFTNKLMLVGVASTFLLTMVVMYVRPLGQLFDLVPLSLMDWFIPISAAFLTMVMAELVKKVLPVDREVQWNNFKRDI